MAKQLFHNIYLLREDKKTSLIGGMLTLLLVTTIILGFIPFEEWRPVFIVAVLGLTMGLVLTYQFYDTTFLNKDLNPATNFALFFLLFFYVINSEAYFSRYFIAISIILVLAIVLYINNFNFKSFFSFNKEINDDNNQYLPLILAVGTFLLSIYASVTWWNSTYPSFSNDSGVYVLASTLDYDDFSVKMWDEYFDRSRSDLINYGYPIIINVVGNLERLIALQHLVRALANAMFVYAFWRISKPISIILGFALSILSTTLVFSHTVWTESLYTSLLIISVAMSIWGLYAHPKYRLFIFFGLGIVIGLTTSIRPVGLLLIVVFVAWALLVRVRLTHIFAIVVGFFILNSLIGAYEQNYIELGTETAEVSTTVDFGPQFVMSKGLLDENNGDVSRRYTNFSRSEEACIEEVYADFGTSTSIPVRYLALKYCISLQEDAPSINSLVLETFRSNPIRFISAFLYDVADFILVEDMARTSNSYLACNPTFSQAMWPWNRDLSIKGWEDQQIIDFYCDTSFPIGTDTGVTSSIIPLRQYNELHNFNKLGFVVLLALLTYMTSTPVGRTVIILLMGIIIYHALVTISFSVIERRYQGVVDPLIATLLIMLAMNVYHSIRHTVMSHIEA